MEKVNMKGYLYVCRLCMYSVYIHFTALNFDWYLNINMPRIRFIGTFGKIIRVLNVRGTDYKFASLSMLPRTILTAYLLDICEYRNKKILQKVVSTSNKKNSYHMISRWHRLSLQLRVIIFFIFCPISLHINLFKIG